MVHPIAYGFVLGGLLSALVILAMGIYFTAKAYSKYHRHGLENHEVKLQYKYIKEHNNRKKVINNESYK